MLVLVPTGRFEKLSVSKGSQIEVSSEEYEHSTGSVWYCVILEDNLAKSKRKKLSVRHLDPLLKEDYSSPLIKTTVHRLIRPVPPADLFSDVDFEAGDAIDAAYKGGWSSGFVIKVLENQRYLVYLRLEVDVVEIKRSHLRQHLIWMNNEWFRSKKQELIESDYSAGKSVEVSIEVDNLGYVWVSAMAIRENENGTVLVKYPSLSGEGDEWTKISLPYSKIRPSPPPAGLISYNLMENVDGLLESGWCPGVVSSVHSGDIYTVVLGPNKESKKFDVLNLRPSIKWEDGAWHKIKRVLDIEKTPHTAEEAPPSTRVRVSIRTALRDKKSLSAGKTLRETRFFNSGMQNPLLASSNGEAVAEAGVSVTVNETPLSKTAALNENTLGTNQSEIAPSKETHSPLVLGIAASSLKKPAVKTQGKTSPRNKLQTMKNQKGCANDSVGEKASEETKNKENVNKRKRGQPKKFISTEPKQKTGVAGNASKAATIERADLTDDDRPLASWIHGGNISAGLAGSKQSVSRTLDPGLNSVVEKHVDVMATPPVTDSTMVLPFAKKSPLWNVIESMEVLKAVPQRPHFSPLLESEEDFREGDAIGRMVIFTGLLEKVNTLQVEDPVSSINRIDESFLKLEKHGFDVTVPRSRIAKLLSIKESQKLALEELKGAEKIITETDSKLRKCEEEIVELQRQQELVKEAKVTHEKVMARMQSHAAVLDQKVQNVDEEFRAIAAAPWK